MIILISLLIGLILLSGTAFLFFKKPLNIIHLLVLFTGLFIVCIILNSEFLNLIISLIIIGASAGYTFRKNKKLLYYIFVSSLSITLILTFNHYYLKIIKNEDILSNSKDSVIEIFKESNISETERAQLIQRIDESLYFISDIVPFMYFLNSFLISLIGIYFLNRIFLRFNNNESNIDGIERFKINEYLIFLYIAAWFIVLLVDRSSYSIIYMAGLNIALVLSCFYLIQAFGIIKFFFAKKGLPFMLLPAAVLASLFFGMEYFLFIITVLTSIGALDFWLDFRKLNIETKNP